MQQFFEQLIVPGGGWEQYNRIFLPYTLNVSEPTKLPADWQLLQNLGRQFSDAVEADGGYAIAHKIESLYQLGLPLLNLRPTSQSFDGIAWTDQVFTTMGAIKPDVPAKPVDPDKPPGHHSKVFTYVLYAGVLAMAYFAYARLR